MVKVLGRRGRSGGAHIEGREGAACPDALCPDNDDDGDHHDGHHVAELPAPSWIPISACRWVHLPPIVILVDRFSPSIRSFFGARFRINLRKFEVWTRRCGGIWFAELELGVQGDVDWIWIRLGRFRDLDLIFRILFNSKNNFWKSFKVEGMIWGWL